MSVEKVNFKNVILYMTPAMLLIIVFFVFPLIFTLLVSLFDWDGITNMNFIGIKNFTYLLSENNFSIALMNTIYWILAATFLHTPFGLLVALILNRKPRGWKFFRTAFFIPKLGIPLSQDS